LRRRGRYHRICQNQDCHLEMAHVPPTRQQLSGARLVLFNRAHSFSSCHLHPGRQSPRSPCYRRHLQIGSLPLRNARPWTPLRHPSSRRHPRQSPHHRRRLMNAPWSSDPRSRCVDHCRRLNDCCRRRYILLRLGRRNVRWLLTSTTSTGVESSLAGLRQQTCRTSSRTPGGLRLLLLWASGIPLGLLRLLT
jgi:hypothetical protein